MRILEVNNLSYSYVDKLLYKDASFTVNEGEHIGITGANGAGKSTLINILLGNIEKDSGDIIWQKDLKFGYIDQYENIDNDKTIMEYLKGAFKDLYKLEKDLEYLYEQVCTKPSDSIYNKISKYQERLERSCFYEIDSIILKMANGLGIDKIGMDTKISSLSGGQKTKVMLAKILLTNSDVLILDEPTNYLDIDHINWLIEFLNSYRGTYLIVSHDLNFLDKVTSHIIDIDFKTIKKYKGSYSVFIKQKELEKDLQEKKYISEQKKIEKLEDYIARNKARASTSRMAKSREKVLEKMERTEKPTEHIKCSFRFLSDIKTSEELIKIHNLSIGYDYPILSNISFKIRSMEKIVITGFNGLGKSTFLKTIMGIIPEFEGTIKISKSVNHIAYFEQEFNFEDESISALTLLKRKFRDMEEVEVRSLLARSGIKSEHISRSISSLSGGEKSKVKLSILEVIPSSILILDEPTNHLDKYAKDALKKALINYKGALIIVSHDEEFYKGLNAKVIDLSSISTKVN